MGLRITGSGPVEANTGDVGLPNMAVLDRASFEDHKDDGVDNDQPEGTSSMEHDLKDPAKHLEAFAGASQKTKEALQSAAVLTDG